MASYLELLDASNDDTLNQRMRVAVVIAAELVRTESTATTNHTARAAWAKTVYADPTAVAHKMIYAVLAQNAAAPLATILAATDASIQTAVNAAIDALA
jgi:hypothetical protein